MNWNAIAAIGQCLEALVVLIGAPFAVWQLWQVREEQKQMLLERTHKQWEALQWALERLGDHIGGDVGTLRNETPHEVAEILKRWHYVGLAVRNDFLDRKLLFDMVGEHFVEAHPRLFPGNSAVQKVKRDGTSEAAFWLTEEANKWAMNHRLPRG